MNSYEISQATAGSQPDTRLRNTAAILSGFFVVVILSLGTDQVLHVLKVYPPWNQPMNDPALNALALSYRCVYSVLGCYIAARLAPQNGMRHAMILGVIGLVASIAGVVAAIGANLGPIWYPMGLVLTALPCAWLGGVLHRAVENAHLGRSAAVA